jgi:hypothetical protein
MSPNMREPPCLATPSVYSPCVPAPTRNPPGALRWLVAHPKHDGPTLALDVQVDPFRLGRSLEPSSLSDRSVALLKLQPTSPLWPKLADVVAVLLAGSLSWR